MELNLRPSENYLVDFFTYESSKNQPPFTLKKVNGQAFRNAEVRKSAGEYSHGLDIKSE